MLVEVRNLWLGNLGRSFRGGVGRDLGRRMVGIRSKGDVLDLRNGNGGKLCLVLSNVILSVLEFAWLVRNITLQSLQDQFSVTPAGLKLS